MSEFHFIVPLVKLSEKSIYTFGLAYHPLVKVQQFAKYLMRKSGMQCACPTVLVIEYRYQKSNTVVPTSQLESPSLWKHHKHEENIYNNIFAKKVFT